MFIFFVFLICYITACQKNGNGVTTHIHPNHISGKWNLQQQKSVIYINGVKHTDTTYMASPANFAHLQFNNNGTFNSASYLLGGGTGTPVLSACDSTSGTYIMVGPDLNMTTSIAGFGVYLYGTTSIAVAPVDKLVPVVSQISLLTTSNLTIHMIYIYTLTPNTYKDELDYYYNK